MDSQGKKTWWRGVPIGHHLRPLVCQVLSPTSCQKVTLALEDISADYAGYEGRSEMQGKVRYGTLDCLDRVFCMFLHMEIPGILRAKNFGLFKQVGACHLCSEEIALISFTRGASLQAALGFHSLNHSTSLRKRHTNILQNKVMLMLYIWECGR